MDVKQKDTLASLLDLELFSFHGITIYGEKIVVITDEPIEVLMSLPVIVESLFFSDYVSEINEKTK